MYRIEDKVLVIDGDAHFPRPSPSIANFIDKHRNKLMFIGLIGSIRNKVLIQDRFDYYCETPTLSKGWSKESLVSVRNGKISLALPGRSYSKHYDPLSNEIVVLGDIRDEPSEMQLFLETLLECNPDIPFRR